MNNEEFNIEFFDEKIWAKGDTGETPIVTIDASVDNTVGTPSVDVNKTGDAEHPHFDIDFKHIKGEKGNTGATPNMTINATVNQTIGEASVEVEQTGTPEHPHFDIAFSGVKGEKGDKGDTGYTPNIEVGASVDNTVGTPNVTVSKTGTPENPRLEFDFKHLKGVKGEKGDTGATPNITANATIDATVGTPSVDVSKSGTNENPVLSFAFHNLKGEKGDSVTDEELETAVNAYMAEQIAPISEAVDDLIEGMNYIASNNLYNYNKAEPQKYMNAQGVRVEHTNFLLTNLINVRGIQKLYFRQFKSNQNIVLKQVLKYDIDGNFIERSSVESNEYTIGNEAYVRFNIDYSPNIPNGTYGQYKYIVIAKTTPTEFEPYFTPHYASKPKISITKNTDGEFLITFGDSSILLFYTDNEQTNSHNWNVGSVQINNHTIIPKNTDILGPVLINDNTDYVGGVHGDETTISIDIGIGGQSYKPSDIEIEQTIEGGKLIIIMASNIYDENTKEKVFERFIQLCFSENNIKISNSYKAVSDCTLKRATNGGLLATYSDLIKSISFNNYYYDGAPSTTQNIDSKYNTRATIQTIYGSMTVKNIIGHENADYKGWLQVFTTEARPRCKVYFDTYRAGTYAIHSGDIISGESELTFG